MNTTLQHQTLTIPPLWARQAWDNAVKSGEWREELHPRDEIGRFESGGASAAVRKVPPFATGDDALQWVKDNLKGQWDYSYIEDFSPDVAHNIVEAATEIEGRFGVKRINVERGIGRWSVTSDGQHIQISNSNMLDDGLTMNDVQSARERGDRGADHTIFLLTDVPIHKAIMQHEIGHMVHLANEEHFAAVFNGHADWRSAFGVTKRAQQFRDEAIAENFTLFINGRLDLMHPDMIAAFVGLSGENTVKSLHDAIKAKLKGRHRVGGTGPGHVGSRWEDDPVVPPLPQRQEPEEPEPQVPLGQRHGKQGKRLPTGGTWEGERGHGRWTPDDPLLKGLTQGQSILFRNGFPRFEPFAFRQAARSSRVYLQFTGDHDKDFAIADAAYAKKLGWVSKSGRPMTGRVAKLRKKQGLTWHHVEDCKRQKMILVPTILHAAVPHQGGHSLCGKKQGGQQLSMGVKSFTFKTYDPNEARDEAGRWTSGGGVHARVLLAPRKNSTGQEVRRVEHGPHNVVLYSDGEIKISGVENPSEAQWKDAAAALGLTHIDIHKWSTGQHEISHAYVNPKGASATPPASATDAKVPPLDMGGGKWHNGSASFTSGTPPYQMSLEDFTRKFFSHVPAKNRNVVARIQWKRFIARAIAEGAVVPADIAKHYASIKTNGEQ